MTRPALLRVLGLCVAVIVLAAATQLLLLSFEANPLVSPDQTDDLVEWIERRPTAGAAIIGGGALVLVVVWLASGLIRSPRHGRTAIVTRRRHGRTSIDRSSLEGAIERSLDPIDRRVDVRVNITRRGRADIVLATPDPHVHGSSAEHRRALVDLIESRQLPCRPGRLTITAAPRRGTAVR